MLKLTFKLVPSKRKVARGTQARIQLKLLGVRRNGTLYFSSLCQEVLYT